MLARRPSAWRFRDLLGITAQGLTTMRRQNKRLDFGQLQKVIRDYNVTEIVVGYPLRMSGAEGTQSDKMKLFAEELHKKFKLPVHLCDERLTSAQANRVLRDSEMSIKRRGRSRRPTCGGLDPAELDGYASNADNSSPEGTP